MYIRRLEDILNVFRTCYPAGNYMFKVYNRNTRRSCEICSKLTSCSTVSIVSFEQVNVDWEFTFSFCALYPGGIKSWKNQFLLYGLIFEFRVKVFLINYHILVSNQNLHLLSVSVESYDT